MGTGIFLFIATGSAAYQTGIQIRKEVRGGREKYVLDTCAAAAAAAVAVA